jgi:ankyrin repeat protein
MRNILLIIIEIFCFSIVFSDFLISEEIFYSRSRTGVIKNLERVRSEHVGLRAGVMPTSPIPSLPCNSYEIFSETDRYFETIDKQQTLDNYNNREFVRKQIFVKPDCSIETKKLVYAITAGDYRTADSVKEKADLNYKDKYGNSVLLCHTNQGIGANLSEQLLWFINNGIDIEQIIYRGERGTLQADGTMKTWKEYEMFSESLIYDSRSLRLLIKKRPDLINVHNPHNGCTLLMSAAGSGNDINGLEILEILLANNADIEAKDFEGYTPLVHAITNRNYPQALLLLSYGANSKISFKVGENSEKGEILNEYCDIYDYIQHSLRSLGQDIEWNRKGSKGELLARELVLMNAKKAVKKFLERESKPMKIEKP